MIQSRSFRKIWDSNLAWMMRYFNFCPDNFCWFLNFLPFYYYQTSDLHQKSHLCFKKPNDAVEFFLSIGSKHHLGASGGRFRLELFDTSIWQKQNFFFLKSSFQFMASKNIRTIESCLPESHKVNFSRYKILGKNSYILILSI